MKRGHDKQAAPRAGEPRLAGSVVAASGPAAASRAAQSQHGHGERASRDEQTVERYTDSILCSLVALNGETEE